MSFLCINEQEMPKPIRMLLSGGITRAIKKNAPFCLMVQLNKECKAGCRYCYASSDDFTDTRLKTGNVFKLIDEAWDLGIRIIFWWGGDPLLHPDWYEILSYSAKKRFVNSIILPGLISKEDARKLVELKLGLTVGIQLDTIDPGIYRLVSKNPASLEERIKGCHNLLAAGFPGQQLIGHIILSRPSCRGVERTIDWFIDEIGVSFVSLGTYKDQKFMKVKKDFEPGLSEKRKAAAYRDKRLGNYLSKLGSADLGSTLCRTVFTVHADGAVSPCLYLYDFPKGNIYRQSIAEIFEKNQDELLFNYEIKGPCSGCKDYKSVCIGCRADAYHYTGDVRAANPKCFKNPDAKEYYSSFENKPRSHANEREEKKTII
jgi:radical SAM protein with 4Fe4S-binding SPASM domain